MSRLKPCPLCGEAAMLDREDIFCDNCHLVINFSDFIYSGDAADWQEAKELAIETWNRRVSVND